MARSHISMKNSVHSLAAALLLGACASYNGASLKTGISSEADARQLMGAPRMELADGDGTRHLIYPHGPLGTQTFVVDVAPDGRVRQVRQALGEDTFNVISPGMKRDEILRLIGPPGETMTFSRSGQTAWDYRFIDVWGYVAIFSVAFDGQGIVVSKFTRRVERDRGAL